MAAKRGAIVTVVELSPQMVEQCRRRFEKAGSTVKWSWLKLIS